MGIADMYPPFWIVGQQSFTFNPVRQLEVLVSILIQGRRRHGGNSTSFLYIIIVGKGFRFLNNSHMLTPCPWSVWMEPRNDLPDDPSVGLTRTILGPRRTTNPRLRVGRPSRKHFSPQDIHCHSYVH